MIDRLVAMGIVCVLLAAGWMFRWQTVEVHNTGDSPSYAYMINRWTGEIRYLQDVQWIEVQELKRHK